MSSTSTSKLDFYFFTMQLVMDIQRVLIVPILAEVTGLIDFIVAYAIIMVLFGLPAIMEAASYMMISPTSMSEGDRRWFRGYQAIALIQVNMNALVSVYVVFNPAIEHVHHFSNNRNDLIKLYSPSCSIKVNHKYSADRANAVELLQPSCSLMNTSRKACELQALFSSPQKMQHYTAVTISMLMVIYMLMFGRSWSTYCWMSRLYLSFVVFYIVILLLHFFNAHNMAKLFQHEWNPLDKQFSEKNSISYILHVFPYCLSLISFFHVAIGYKAGDSAKRNFVMQWSAVCLTNFVLLALLSTVNIMQKTSMMSLCNFSIVDLKAYTSLPGDISLMQRRSSLDGLTRENYFVLAESIISFRETSGYTPWVTYLPYETLMIVFAMMTMCQYFVICDIYASIVFKENSRYVFAISVLRFCLMMALELITTDGLPKDFDYIIVISITLTFHLLRMVHCILIHFGKGFPEHLRSRRHLISEKSKVQLFVYDWYIGPAIAYLFNFGYPLLFIFELLYHWQTLFTLETGLFYFTAQVLPSITCMVVSYCMPL